MSITVEVIPEKKLVKVTKGINLVAGDTIKVMVNDVVHDGLDFTVPANKKGYLEIRYKGINISRGLMHKGIDNTIKELRESINNHRDLISYQELHIKELLKQLEDYADDGIIRYGIKDNHNLRQEFAMCDNRLKFIFLSYALAIFREYKYRPLITMIQRSQVEQDPIYLNVKKMDNGVWIPDTDPIEKYKVYKWVSPHQDMRAMDFRDRDMDEAQIHFTIKYLGEQQVVYTGEKDTLLRHAVGNFGSHFHLQVDKDQFTSIKKLENQTNEI